MSESTPRQKLRMRSGAILVINCGSSSVKFALFGVEPSLSRFWSGSVDRIGIPDTHLHVVDGKGSTVIEKADPLASHEEALTQILELVEQHGPTLAAVGHRVVHGGENDGAVVVTTAVEMRLRQLIPLAPLHQPHNVAGISAVRKVRPHVPQVACFDTAFHHDLQRLATLTALPRSFHDQGVRRYGFHGLSYEYIVMQLCANGVDVAHLGNGASMCALKGGRSVETTMGFSTLSGLPMGTRCGDLDPGLVLYLLSGRGMSVERVQDLLYEESGLLGMSGLSSSMEDLLSLPVDPAAVEAIEAFCYQARQHVAALTASIGGLDRLVFTGGIGANAPAVRAKICEGLEYLGITLDAELNADNDRVISADAGNVIVEAFATDEEVMIAHHVGRVLAAKPLAAREA